MLPNAHFECGTCWKEFPAGWRARENHCQSTNHRRPAFECDTCQRNFGSETAFFQHMRAVDYFAHQCTICDETWPTESQLENTRSRTVSTAVAVTVIFKTLTTSRWFIAQDQFRWALINTEDKQHLRSRIHNVTNILCPFCKTAFATATGLTYHLERGACPQAQGLSRDEMYPFIRRKDPDGLISTKLISWHGTPSYEVTSRAWNGSGMNITSAQEISRCSPA